MDVKLCGNYRLDEVTSSQTDQIDWCLPERRAAVHHGDGFGHVSVVVLSKHAALHPFMEHLHFTLEAGGEGSSLLVAQLAHEV